jgi:hypothetical protein
MESNKNNSLTLTQKRIASAKGLHIICAIAAMILNIIAFAVLAVNVAVTEITFLVFPLVLAVLDVLFLVKAIFSNYRFKYAVGGAVLHSVIVLAVSVIAYAVMGSLEAQNGTVFVTASMYAMLIVHVVQSIAILATAFYATKSKKSAAKIFGVLFTVVFLASAGIYGRMLLADGFFGQGAYSGYRTVVYKYDAQSQTYTAADVLDGYGTDVRIPHKFNGSHVAYIDCALFSHEELTSVEVAWMDQDGCQEKLGFVGVDRLDKLNPELKLLSPQGYMNDFRKALYKLSELNHYALELANHVYPSDVKENEVYISFGYDAETLALVGADNIIPVWVRDKGTAFDVREHGAGLPYVANSDATDPAQLYWCHEHLAETIFKCVVDADGNEVTGAINESVINATVVFEKLYHLEIKPDNEAPDKTPIKDEHRYMWDGDNRIDYIITTAGNMQAKLDAIPERKGFTLMWKTGTNKHELAALAEELALLDAAGKNTLTVYPEWTLKAPTVNTLTAGGSASGYEAVYGSDAVLSSSASHENDKIALKYEWFYGGAKIAEGASHTLENIYPGDFAGVAVKAGTYTLRVTAGADGVTKLTSVTEKTVEIGFKKKTLDFTWVLPEGSALIYNAESKNGIIEGTSFNASDVINGDTVEFRILSNSAALDVKNAGTYALRLELTGACASLYEIKADKVNNSVEIKPLTVDAVWDSTDNFIYVYDGTEKYPACTVTPLGGDVINIEISGKGKNYAKGGYTASVSIDNPNYTVSDETKTQKFTVAKRPVSITGWDVKTFVYNSREQYPKVLGVQNLAGSDSLSSIADDIIYDGKQVNVNTAGQYTVSASLPEIYNYEFTDASTCLYDITPAYITVHIADKEMTYNGGTYGAYDKNGFTFTVTGLQGSDTADEIFAVSYGDAKDAVNWREGGYAITATLNGTGKAKFRNYNVVAIQSGMLTINKRPVTVTIDSVTKTYDATPFTQNNASFKVSGLADTDDITEVLALDYKGEAIGAVNYRMLGYTIDADVLEGEKFANYSVTLKKGMLTMKKAPITVYAIGGEKIYDGKPAEGFSFDVTGLVGGETIDMLGTPVYSGAAVTQYYAATHEFTLTLPENSVTNNYTVVETVKGQYVIHKKALVVELVSGSSKTYDGNKPSQMLFDFNVSGLIDGEYKSDLGNPTYTGDATNAVNVGSYTISIDKDGFSGTTYARNYEITVVDGVFEITPRHITVSITSGKTMTYNGSKPTFDANNFTVSGLAAKDRVSDFSYEFIGAATESVNVGKRALEVKLGNKGGAATGIMDNYTVEYVPGTFEITPRSLTIKVNDISKTYDGAVADPNKFSVQFSGVVEGDEGKLGNIVFTGWEDAVDAGAYTVKASIPNPTEVCDNYNISYQSGTLTIDQKKLVVIVQDVTKQYDGTSVTPEFTVRPDDEHGLAASESSLADIGEINFKLSQYNPVNAGTYTINANFSIRGEAYDNYFVEFKEGTYTITAKQLEVYVGGGIVTYNGKPFDVSALGFTVNAEGLINGETVSVLGAPVYEIYKGGVKVDEARDAGDYAVKVTFPENANYEIVLTEGLLTVAPMQITVTPTAEARVSDGTKGGSFDYVIEGIDDAEEIARIRAELGAYTFSENVLEAEAAGTYTFDIIFEAENANYEITKNKGTFVITAPAPAATTVDTSVIAG